MRPPLPARVGPGLAVLVVALVVAAPVLGVAGAADAEPACQSTADRAGQSDDDSCARSSSGAYAEHFEVTCPTGNGNAMVRVDMSGGSA